MQAVEAPRGQADFNCLLPHATRKQLPACHDPVLILGQLANPSIQTMRLP